MTHPSSDMPDVDAISADLLRLSPDYRATPLVDLPALARHLGVAQVLAKDEGRRALGSFKSLGGTYAGLRALARATGRPVTDLLDADRRPEPLPGLVCASDGNHGLAVAFAARCAGAQAHVYLHAAVPPVRAHRIEAQGATIVWTPGTYDDAVAAAAKAAQDGGSLLIADTTTDADDPVVRDVMAGYGVMAAEIRRQVEAMDGEHPTHLFVQAGVGGLAAAMATGLGDWLAAPAVLVAVEPDRAAFVSAALAADRLVQVAGDLDTAAEMLACGEASAAALAPLRRVGARGLTVSEADLSEAPSLLARMKGPQTTPSGAAGLAGLVRCLKVSPADFGLGPESRVLILVTEGALEAAP